MRESTTAAGFKNGRLQNTEKTMRAKCILAMVRLHTKESTFCIKFLIDYDINAEFKHIFTEKVLASLRTGCMVLYVWQRKGIIPY